MCHSLRHNWHEYSYILWCLSLYRCYFLIPNSGLVFYVILLLSSMLLVYKLCSGCGSNSKLRIHIYCSQTSFFFVKGNPLTNQRDRWKNQPLAQDQQAIQTSAHWGEPNESHSIKIKIGSFFSHSHMFQKPLKYTFRSINSEFFFFFQNTPLDWSIWRTLRGGRRNSLKDEKRSTRGLGNRITILRV